MRVNSKTKAKNIIDTRKRSSRFPYKVTYQIRFLTDTLQETDSSVQGTASSASRFTRLATLSPSPSQSEYAQRGDTHSQQFAFMEGQAKCIDASIKDSHLRR